MLYSQHILRDSHLRLQNIDKQIKKDSKVDDIIKTRFFGVCFDLMIALEESFFTFNNFTYRTLKELIRNATMEMNDSESGNELKEHIANILAGLTEDMRFAEYSLSDFTGAVHTAVINYSQIDTQNMLLISNSINKTTRNVNVLDPRCRDGRNLEALKPNFEHATTFGVESEASIADQAKQRVDRVAKGTLSGSRISNEAFDVMVLEPAVTWNFNENTTHFIKNEKKYMQDTLKYLRYGGVGIYIVPYFRMYKDICILIAKNFSNIQVRKLDRRDFNDKGLLVITGIKTNSKEIDEEGFKLLRRSYNIDSVPFLSQTELTKMSLPNSYIEIETFRGSVLDFDEMEKIVQASDAMTSFWNMQEVEKLSENAKQPLLPFNIGQIGLVLTSGCLDGIVDEGDGYCHAIKGRVSKKSSVNRNTVDGRIEIEETISNRVEINVMLPNGEYKTLA